MTKKTDIKSWITIAVFIIMLLGYGAKIVLMTDQVKRNTQQLKEAELKVLIYKMEQIEKKVDKLLDIME